MITTSRSLLYLHCNKKMGVPMSMLSVDSINESSKLIKSADVIISIRRKKLSRTIRRKLRSGKLTLQDIAPVIKNRKSPL